MGVDTQQDSVGVSGGSAATSRGSMGEGRHARDAHAGDDGAGGLSPRTAGTTPRRGTTAAWASHEAAKRAAALSADEKEAQADELLAKHKTGGKWLSKRTVSRRRAREIPISQLEAPQYSGTRRLLHSMAESLRLIDEQEHTSLDEWLIRWEVMRAIRAERALTGHEKEALLDRLQGETLRKTAQRLGVSHEQVRKLLAAGLEKYYAGKLRQLEAASAAAMCFEEDASRRVYRRPNCCGQSPLCIDGASTKPCARHRQEKPNQMKDEDVRPGDLNYCPLAHLPRRL